VNPFASHLASATSNGFVRSVASSRGWNGVAIVGTAIVGTATVGTATVGTGIAGTATEGTIKVAT